MVSSLRVRMRTQLIFEDDLDSVTFSGGTGSLQRGYYFQANLSGNLKRVNLRPVELKRGKLRKDTVEMIKVQKREEGAVNAAGLTRGEKKYNHEFVIIEKEIIDEA
ncbi:hypothetical protein HAX54_034470 [Datura stramonium]|uniref:Uncharacterized protein n=1 Tax=Datura stramonium TaxID=4076 RepID=A0ABS8SE84_DATST|nr:hypothetical protein [Datura stramonium]